MARDERFTFLCTKKEKNLLSIVAKQMKRSQGDTVRVLICQAAEKLGISDQKEKTNDVFDQGGEECL